mmetsp:Transcript_85529/g.151382  ORF Transcript_85529/g.151382 Transcript_85529/m.151382 type:complete len:232 (+) Transcript_85529:56-751(+)
MSYVSRSDYERLEWRLAQAEQAIRKQDALIKGLQATFEALELPPDPHQLAPWSSYNGGGGRERSRTPMARPSERRPVAIPPRRSLPEVEPAFDGEVSVEEFAAQNGLDEKCTEVLLQQSPEVQSYVIGLGPAEGRNPSAMVMGRITKASSIEPASAGGGGKGGRDGGRGSLSTEVEDFIRDNGLDEKCSEALRKLDPEGQAAVINLGPAAGRNASAMVMGRLAKYNRGELK